MDINVSPSQSQPQHQTDSEQSETVVAVKANGEEDPSIVQQDAGVNNNSHANTQLEFDTPKCDTSDTALIVSDHDDDEAPNNLATDTTSEKEEEGRTSTSKVGLTLAISDASSSTAEADEDEEEFEEEEEGEGAEYDIITGNMTTENKNGGSSVPLNEDAGGGFDASSMLQNMSFDDIQFFHTNHHRSLRLQPQFQFHQDQLNDPNNFHLTSNLSCFDASGLVNLSGSGSGSFSLIGDSTGGDINSAFPENSFVFPDNVMEYGDPQFFPGNCVGYLETILEEDDEEYEEEEGCSGRHWWTADSDTDTDSVIRVDNNGQTHQQKHSLGTPVVSVGTTQIVGEKECEVKPHFRSSASSRPFELEDLHLFDQLDHAFEETLREPRRRSFPITGHQSQSVEFANTVRSSMSLDKTSTGESNYCGLQQKSQSTSVICDRLGSSNYNENKTDLSNEQQHHHVYIASETANNEENQSGEKATTKGLQLLTQENVKAHSEENSGGGKTIYEVASEGKEQSNNKLGNAESRETFGSSLSPSSSDSEAPAEVAEEDFFYSSPGSSEEEECRSQEETESEESCSSDDSEKKGVVLAEFSLGSAGGTNGCSTFNQSSSGGMMFGNPRNRRSFESPSRLKSFRSFDSLNCLAGTELLFSKPDTFPSIHHIKEVSEPSSESDSNEVSVAEDDRGLTIPEEDQDEIEREEREQAEREKNTEEEGSRSLPTQTLNTSTTVGFPGPSLNPNKNSASSSTSTVSSSTSGSGLRSTENLSEDSGIGNDGISSTAASTPGAFIEESNVIMSPNNGKNEDATNINNKPATATSIVNTSSHSTKSQNAHQDFSSDPNLFPDSAKDYITRAEFALNPFVFSSLSSSEPESSINSAPSLTTTTTTCYASTNGKMNIIDSDSSPTNTTNGSLLHLHNNSKSFTNGDKIGLGNTAHSFKNYPMDQTEQQGKSHDDDDDEFALSSSPSDKPDQVCSKVQNAHNPFNNDEDSSDRSETKQNGDFNSKTNHNHQQQPASIRLTFSDENMKHVDSSSPDISTTSSSFSLTSESETPTTLILPSSNYKGKTAQNHTTTASSVDLNLHPQSHSQAQPQPVLVQTGISHQSIISPPKNSSVEDYYDQDRSQDKHELANNGYISATEGQPIINNMTMSSSSSPSSSSSSSSSANVPVTSSHEQENPVVNGTCTNSNPSKEDEKLANILVSTLSSQLPATHKSCNNKTITLDPSRSNNFVMGHRQTRAEKECGTAQAAAVQTYNMSALMMDGNAFKQNDKKNSTTQKPQKLTTQQTLQENSSCTKGLYVSKVDAEEGEKHVSSFPITSLDDKFLPTTRGKGCEEQGEHLSTLSYSSSSSSGSGDEQCDHIPQRFQRQRSDSESEYEAAETAMEENNLDRAYDIIVNSPSKKKASSPTSAVSCCSTSSSSSSLAKEKEMKNAEADAPAVHSQSQNEMNTYKCYNIDVHDDVKSGPVSTLSSTTDVDDGVAGRGMRSMNTNRNINGDDYREGGVESHINKNANSTTPNDSIEMCYTEEKLPVFESSIDDYLTDDKVSQTVALTSNTSIATTNSPSREIKNTSLLLLHHHQLQQEYRKLQRELLQRNEYENSDELTPTLAIHCYNPTSGSPTTTTTSSKGDEEQHKSNSQLTSAVFASLDKPRKQEGPVTRPRIIHQQQHNNHHVLRSASADVTCTSNLPQNHNNNNNNASHPVAGVSALKSNRDSAYYSSNESNQLIPQHQEEQKEQQHIAPTNNHNHSHPSTLSDTVSSGGEESKGYHGSASHSSYKLVITDPYYPNEIGVAQVKKFLSGYVAQNSKEFAQFSGPVESASQKSSSTTVVAASTSSTSSLDESGKQKGNFVQQHQQNTFCSQSLNRNPVISERSTSKVSIESSSTSTQVKTGRERRVILGDSNFGFFGVVHESHESVVKSYACPSTNVLPQANLDLHSISTSESCAFSPGYGFPYSLPVTEEKQDKLLHARPPPPPLPQRKESDTWCEKGTASAAEKEENHNTLCPPNNANTNVKRSVSPSSKTSSSAVQKLSKDLHKPSIKPRRDQQSKDNNNGRGAAPPYNQHNYNPQHLHLEDINLYADKFSVPLGAIRALNVAVAPTIPSYILGSSALENSNSISREHEQNGNLSTQFPKGTIKTCTKSSSTVSNINNSTDAITLPKGGENNDAEKSSRRIVASSSTSFVPDILLLKQQNLCKSSGNRKSVEGISFDSAEKEEKKSKKNLYADNNDQVRHNLKEKNIKHEQEQLVGSVSNNNIIPIAGVRKSRNESESSSSSSSCSVSGNNSRVEMLRSDSPSSSSAPSGLPLKTKIYGPVEVVVVSSRTPSPAPGYVVSSSTLSSSSSSRKPPSSPASSGQEHHQQPVFSYEESKHRQSDVLVGASCESSSIPPPPLSPSSSSKEQQSTKATTRSRVHFSPVVSEISWRESYIDQSSETGDSTDDLLARLEALETDGSNLAKGGRNGNSANSRKPGAAVVYTGIVAGDNLGGGGGDCDNGSSTVRPLQIYDAQMSTRAESPIKGPVPSSKGPILVEKVEMTSSPLHDHCENVNSKSSLGSESHEKIFLSVANKHDVDDDDEDEGDNNQRGGDDDVDNDTERVTDLVDFRSASGKSGGNNDCSSEENNGTFGLYEDVQVQINPTTKSHASTTLSMVPDLLSQCETSNTLTHIDVKIEEAVPNISTKNIVLNIGSSSSSSKDNNGQRSNNHQHSKSQSPQPREQSRSPEPKQIFPKMFEDDKHDKRNSSSSSSLTGALKDKKKGSKGFIISGLGTSSKKSTVENNGNNGSHTPHQVNPASSSGTIGDGNKESEVDCLKESKKSSKPGFFERLSKIRLSSGSKTKKQKVHPKHNELHQQEQQGEQSGQPTVTTTTTTSSVGGKPPRSVVTVNGNSGNRNNGAAQGQVQPILKKSTSSTVPSSIGPNYNNEMGLLSGDSENEPDDATQAFENILEEIAGLKSIQLRQEKSSSSSIEKSPNSSSQQVRSFAKRKQFYNSAASPSPPTSPTSQQNSRGYQDLDSKLTQFKEETHRNLEALSKSHPDLEKIEDAVKQRQKSLSPEPSKHYEEIIEHENASGNRRPGASATLPKMSSAPKSPSQAAQEHAQNSEREWYRLLKSAAEKYSYNSRGTRDENLSNFAHKTGIVETDLDTGASREMLDEDMLQLDYKVPCYTVSISEIPTTVVASAASTSVSISTTAGSPATAAKTRSLTNLSSRLPLSIAPSQFDDTGTGDLSDSEERAKSLEFLLDDNHKSSSVPPENKLRQLETRQLSEHELRIQRSLQRLNVPEWYKQHGTLSSGTNNVVSAPSTQTKSASILKRSEYGSSGGLAGGWTGLSTYKAPSMSSLQSSNGGRSSGTLTNKSNFVRGRPQTMSATRTSKESLLTSGSASHSPSAFERSSFTYGMPFTMTRFGQGRLSTHSSSVSPPSTPDSSAKVTNTYVKKPYLGWRSQEKLNAATAAASATGSSTGNTSGPPKLSIYLPPAERLAADLLSTRAKSPVRPPVSDRPPLPKAPPRSEKTQLTSNRAHLVVDESLEKPGAPSPSQVINRQTSSSVAVVTKLPQSQSNSIPPPEFSQGSTANESSSQSHHHHHPRNKIQSSKATSQDVHDSIRQVTSAINQYVNKGHEDQSQRKVKPKSGKKQAIWIESSFVGQKPPTT